GPKYKISSDLGPTKVGPTRAPIRGPIRQTSSPRGSSPALAETTSLSDPGAPGARRRDPRTPGPVTRGPTRRVGRQPPGARAARGHLGAPRAVVVARDR